MKTKKFEYWNVIQQHYGQGWEDVSHYEANSKGKSIGTALHSGKFITSQRTGKQCELSLLAHDLAEYRTTGYPTRVIFRREKPQL